MRKQRRFYAHVEQLESRIVLSSLSLTGRGLHDGMTNDPDAPAEVQLIDDSGSGGQPAETQSEMPPQNSTTEPASNPLNQTAEIQNERNDSAVLTDSNDRPSQSDDTRPQDGTRPQQDETRLQDEPARTDVNDLNETRLQNDVVLRTGTFNRITTDTVNDSNVRTGQIDPDTSTGELSDFDLKQDDRKLSDGEDSVSNDQQSESDSDSRNDSAVNEANKTTTSDDVSTGDSREDREENRETAADGQPAQLLQTSGSETSGESGHADGTRQQVASIGNRDNVYFPPANQQHNDGTTPPATGTQTNDAASPTRAIDNGIQQSQLHEPSNGSGVVSLEWDAEHVAVAELFAMTISLPFSRRFAGGAATGQSGSGPNIGRWTPLPGRRTHQGSGSRRRGRYRNRLDRSETFSRQNNLLPLLNSISASSNADAVLNPPLNDVELSDEFFMTLSELPDRRERSDDSSEPASPHIDLAGMIPESFMAAAAAVGTGYYAADRARRRREESTSRSMAPPPPRYTGPTVIR